LINEPLCLFGNWTLPALFEEFPATNLPGEAVLPQESLNEFIFAEFGPREIEELAGKLRRSGSPRRRPA